jgi:hypothetical protein
MFFAALWPEGRQSKWTLKKDQEKNRKYLTLEVEQAEDERSEHNLVKLLTRVGDFLRMNVGIFLSSAQAANSARYATPRGVASCC